MKLGKIVNKKRKKGKLKTTVSGVGVSSTPNVAVLPGKLFTGNLPTNNLKKYQNQFNVYGLSFLKEETNLQLLNSTQLLKLREGDFINWQGKPWTVEWSQAYKDINGKLQKIFVRLINTEFNKNLFDTFVHNAT